MRLLKILIFGSNPIWCFSFKMQSETDFSARALTQSKHIINNLIWSLKSSSYIIMSLCYLHYCYRSLLLTNYFSNKDLLISSFNLFWLNSCCSHFSIISFEKSLPSFELEICILSHQENSSSIFSLLFLPKHHFLHHSNSTSSCVCAICSGSYITHCKTELFHLLRIPWWPPKSISINQNKIRNRVIKTMQIINQLQTPFQSSEL